MKNDFYLKWAINVGTNPRYDQEKWPRNFFFELSISCERALCKLQKDVCIVGIGHSTLKLWLIKCEK